MPVNPVTKSALVRPSSSGTVPATVIHTVTGGCSVGRERRTTGPALVVASAAGAGV